MADRKPIRWAVPLGGESYMGIAAYYLTHEENMRKSFSQPSRNVRRTLPDGTTIDYIMNDVVDCIRISPPKGMQKPVGKNMTWDKLPPFEEGTSTINFSEMTEDPLVTGRYYCTVSVINGTDENGRTLPAEFSVDTEDSGWSIEQGIRQDDGTYKVDGKSATLLLGADVEGECDIVARDRKTELRKTVEIETILEERVLLVVGGKYITPSDYCNGNPNFYDEYTQTKTPQVLDSSSFTYEARREWTEGDYRGYFYSTLKKDGSTIEEESYDSIAPMPPAYYEWITPYGEFINIKQSNGITLFIKIHLGYLTPYADPWISYYVWYVYAYLGNRFVYATFASFDDFASASFDVATGWVTLDIQCTFLGASWDDNSFCLVTKSTKTNSVAISWSDGISMQYGTTTSLLGVITDVVYGRPIET